MMRPAAAFSCAFMAFAASEARAQSLSDAINEALAPIPNPISGVTVPASVNCGPLAGTTRFRDVYQFFDNDPLADTVDITNGQTGLTTTVDAPVNVDDGVGNVFPVRQSTFPSLDPAIAQALTEAELISLFQANGVQRIEVIRTPAGAFGPGLAGFCQSALFRTNSNGNSGGAGGFAGGSSSASGRSVSSLSSARDQSKKEKKRKKKSDRNASSGDGRIRLASNDQGLGVVADAAGVGPLGIDTFVDFRGGYTDIDRDTTALEGGFEGRALWGQGAITAELAENIAVSGSISYSRARGDFDQLNASGGANRFRERNVTGGLFVLASYPLSNELSLDLAAGGFFGSGSGDIERTFSVARDTSYRVDVFVDPANPGAGVDTIDLLRTSLISDDLFGDFDTRNYGFSAAASVSLPLGGFVVTPGVEFTWFSFRQDAYDESVSDSFSNGLALSYSEFTDRWTETRLGGVISRSFGRVRLEGYGDLVLTGGAATPTRTASFVEDLRADPYVLTYQIDDLDKAFGVFGLVAAFSVSEGIEAFVGGETNVAHDYLRTRSVFAGIRFTP
ncbi:MAG: autotransporter outer membrane beta-barrel domain-containing protein [Parvularculaceae bacterium]|nr:autotransporter outer membrane beta-barrel domain-containing protein [Parvularculaceae bacterium]